MGEECSNLIVPPDKSRLTNPIVSKENTGKGKPAR